MTKIPEHKIHLSDDRRLIGREYPEIHSYMDRPSKWMGKQHRRVRHDLGTVLAILLITQNPKAAVSALIHITRDFSETKYNRGYNLQRVRGRRR